MSERVLVVDNYDSFTYNLVQYLGTLGAEVEVWRNDRFSLEEVAQLAPHRVVLSPGPCTPDQAGQCLDLVRRYGSQLPILGVCLGHQAIGQAFGARVVRAAHLLHGKTSQIHHDGKGVYTGLPQDLVATRYHSLVVEDLPADLIPTAWATESDGSAVLMGLRHRFFPIEGVQFHPESILTESGPAMLAVGGPVPVSTSRSTRFSPPCWPEAVCK